MNALLIHDLPDEVLHQLEARAKTHHRSVDAEAREVLMEACRAQEQVGIGDVLASTAREFGVPRE